MEKVMNTVRTWAVQVTVREKSASCSSTSWSISLCFTVDVSPVCCASVLNIVHIQYLQFEIEVALITFRSDQGGLNYSRHTSYCKKIWQDSL